MLNLSSWLCAEKKQTKSLPHATIIDGTVINMIVIRTVVIDSMRLFYSNVMAETIWEQYFWTPRVRMCLNSRCCRRTKVLPPKHTLTSFAVRVSLVVQFGGYVQKKQQQSIHRLVNLNGFRVDQKHTTLYFNPSKWTSTAMPAIFALPWWVPDK